MFLFPPVSLFLFLLLLFSVGRQNANDRLENFAWLFVKKCTAHIGMWFCFVSLLLLRTPISRPLRMDLHLDGFPAISGNALEVSQGDLRGWPVCTLTWQAEAQVAPSHRGVPRSSCGLRKGDPITQRSSTALHNCTRLTFTVPVLLVGN